MKTKIWIPVLLFFAVTSAIANESQDDKSIDCGTVEIKSTPMTNSEGETVKKYYMTVNSLNFELSEPPFEKPDLETGLDFTVYTASDPQIDGPVYYRFKVRLEQGNKDLIRKGFLFKDNKLVKESLTCFIPWR